MPDADRRLAAILSADVASYSRLMADDEDATVRMLRAWREQVSSLITEHRGQLADFTGDNFLAEFPAARDAVECGLEIQRVIEVRNAALPEARRMRFRIGGHLGDVRHEDGRLFGDGVNIAARLQPLAEPGGLCLSAMLVEAVRGRLDLPLEDLGEQELKNIPNAVRAYRVRVAPATGATDAKPLAKRRATPQLALGAAVLAVLAIGAFFAFRTRDTVPETAGASAASASDAALAPIRSLAVLPLANLSGDPEQEFFADGMTETLIAELAKLPGVRIISRTSVMQFKGAKTPLPEIAKQLNVDGVIEGSVMRSKSQVRITAQLIDARSDQHVWAEQYDRELARVFEVQSEVARAVAAQISLALTPEQAARLKAPKPVDPRAQEAYFRGLAQRDQEGDYFAARKSFATAVELAPDFAPAWAALSIWVSAGCYIGCLDPARTGAEARAAAERALALDPNLGDAHTAMGLVRQFFDWDWRAAEAEMRRAAELSSRTDRWGGPAFYSLLLQLGRREEARAEYQRWSSTWGSDSFSAAMQVWFLIRIGEFERAVEESAVTVRLYPTSGPAHFFRVEALEMVGDYEEAARAAERWLSLVGAEAGGELIANGWRDAGRDGYLRAREKSEVGVRHWFLAAAACALRGDKAAAFAQLETAYAKRDPALRQLTMDPWLRSLHGDPRFADLARRMNLPLPMP